MREARSRIRGQELMIEDTPGYREMMRMTHDDFCQDTVAY